MDASSGWEISLHGEAGVHPLVSDIWGHGGVLDQTSDHCESWIDVGEGPSFDPLGVEVVDSVLEDVGEGLIPVAGIEADEISLDLGLLDEDLLDSWEEDEVLHGHVDVGLEVHGELNGDLLLGGSVRADEVKLGENTVLFSDNNTVSSVEGDWSLGVAGHQSETDIDVDILTVVIGDLWHNLSELGSDVLVVDHVWEEVIVSNLEEGVDSALMNIELLTMGVCESWWVLVVDGNFPFGVYFLTLWDVEETVHEELDEVGSFLNLWSGGHGEVQWELLSEKREHEGVVTLTGNHFVEFIDLSVDDTADLWEHVLDDLVDDALGDLDEPVEEGVLHLNVDLSDVDLGGLDNLPVNFIVRGRLNNEFDGQVGDIDVGSLEWNELQGIELGIDVHVDVDATELNLNFIGTVNVLERFLFESIDLDEVNVLEVKCVKSALHLVIDVEGLVVQLEVGEKWHEGLHDVVDRRRVERSADCTWSSLSVGGSPQGAVLNFES